MKAVVLVGGEGTRLRPLTLTRPKQMLPVGRVPMIERVLGWLAGHGVDEAVLSLGYRPEAFLKAYPDGECAGVRLRYAVEDSPLDTAGAVRFAAAEGGIDETFVVVNGDVLTTQDLSALVSFHRRRRAEATIALTPVDDPSAFGVVPTETDGRVIAFIEKPRPGEAPTNLVNAGTYVVDPSVLERVPEGRRVSIERETFPELVREGRLYALGSEAPWMDAGTPATYLAANLELAGDEPGGSVVQSVVGEDVELGPDAIVERSVLMDGCRIGPGAHVRESIIGARAVVGAGARLSELCVVGDGYLVDEGSVLAGVRLPAPS